LFLRILEEEEVPDKCW